MSDNKCSIHKTSIGGQAVIEGVMMKGPDAIATSVRKPDGEIETEIKEKNLKVSINLKVLICERSYILMELH